MKNYKFIYAIGLISALFTAKNVNAQDWQITGNSGTNPSSNFIGTTDAAGVDLRFRTKNAERMSIKGTNGKVSIGSAPFSYMGQLTVTGSNAIAINGTNPYLSLYENGAYKGYLWSRGGSGDIVVGASTTTGKVILAPNYVDALVATPSGKIGIGTSTPASLLTMQSNSTLTTALDMNNTSTGGVPYRLQSVGSGVPGRIGNFELWRSDFGINMLTIQPGGNVGIGTTTPAHKLDVCGTIRAKEVRVESGWCDYVFASDYQLKSIDEVAEYIKENNHLPGIVPASEVESEGLKLGEMSKAMMEKIEELTLYVVQLNNNLKEKDRQISDLQHQVTKISNR